MFVAQIDLWNMCMGISPDVFKLMLPSLKPKQETFDKLETLAFKLDKSIIVALKTSIQPIESCTKKV